VVILISVKGDPEIFRRPDRTRQPRPVVPLTCDYRTFDRIDRQRLHFDDEG
jgi:hypothetical protein